MPPPDLFMQRDYEGDYNNILEIDLLAH